MDEAADTAAVGGGDPVLSCTWRRVTPPAGTAEPVPRCAHACAALDGGGLLLYGGYGDDGPIGDLWRLDVGGATATAEGADGDGAGASTHASWSQLEPTGDIPTARSGHSLVGLGQDTFLLFGGVGTNMEGFNDLHLLDASTARWTRVEPQDPGSGGGAPSPRYNHRAIVLDDWGGAAAMMVTGGFTTDDLDSGVAGRPVGECWSLELGPTAG